MRDMILNQDPYTEDGVPRSINRYIKKQQLEKMLVLTIIKCYYEEYSGVISSLRR